MKSLGIVIVDDDENDITDVLETLVGIASRRMKVDYVSSSYEILSEMKDKIDSTGKPYGALITDFNMDGINGKQLIQVVTGRLHGIDKGVVKQIKSFSQVPDKEVRQYLRDNFKNPVEYERFRLKHQDIVIILHSGNSYGDSYNNLPDEIDFVHKNNRDACEQIVEILRDKNVLTERDLKIFNNEIQPRSYDFDTDYILS